MSESEHRFLDCCRRGHLSEAKALVSSGVDPLQFNDEGENALIVSSRAGHEDIVAWLLELGLPWNALDKGGYCAGDYALQHGHEAIKERLIDAGCRAELVFSAMDQQTPSSDKEDAFLKGDIIFRDGCIIDTHGDAVMMQWEAGLMEAHAEALCVEGRDILNVGFGLGMIDVAIQRRRPKSHTIVEAHPQIYAKMIEEKWNERPGVRIIHARWQDVIRHVSGFDGIFFDTYGEHYNDLREFHRELPRLLNPGGIYSFFNGLAPDNAFFHLVYCEIVSIELKRLGLTTQYVALPINLSDETWNRVRHRYWWSNVYNLPVAQMATDA